MGGLFMNKLIAVALVASLAFAAGCRGIKAKKNKKNKQRVEHVDGKSGLKSYGGVTASGVTVDFVQASGGLDLENATVRGDCSSRGGGRLKQVTIDGDCSMSGSGKLTDVTIHGSCTTRGSGSLKQVKVGGDCSTSGSARLTDVTVGNLLITRGSCSATKLKAKDATFTGSANVSDGSFETITARGSFKMTNTSANDIVSSGSFKAADSTCKAIALKPHTSKTDLVLFKSTATDIIIEQGAGSNGFSINIFGFHYSSGSDTCEEATLVLDGSTVSGDITFKNIKGTVVLRNGAQVVGQVIGGQAIAG